MANKRSPKKRRPVPKTVSRFDYHSGSQKFPASITPAGPTPLPPRLVSFVPLVSSRASAHHSGR